MEEKWEISIAFDGNVNLIQLLLFSHQVVSDSPQPHELHAGLPCSSLSPRVCPDSCPLSQWCHSTILPSFTRFCPWSFPASGSYPVNWLFPSGDQSTGASASALVLPVNTEDWHPLGLTGLSSFLSKVLSRVFSSTTVWKHQFFDLNMNELWVAMPFILKLLPRWR